MLAFEVSNKIVGQVIAAVRGLDVVEDDGEALLLGQAHGFALDLVLNLPLQLNLTLLQIAKLDRGSTGSGGALAMQRGELRVKVALGRLVLFDRLLRIGLELGRVLLVNLLEAPAEGE